MHHTNTRSWYKPDQMLDTKQVQSLKQYRKIKDTLTVHLEQNLILKDNRIVLPRCYQNIAIKLAHQGHQGLMKTKALLRSKICFFCMASLVAQEIDCCIPCQAVSKKTRYVPLHFTQITPNERKGHRRVTP